MEDRLVDYCVVSDHDEDKLTKEVKKLIVQGWIPQGGISVAAPVVDGVPAPLWSQAMVRRG